MRRLFWTDPAVADLESIHAYIARDSAVYADAAILDILDATERLIDFPDSGRSVPELHDEEPREIIVGNYRVMYEVDAQIVRVLTVLHGAKDFPT